MPIPDRQKQRREYLWQKTGSYSLCLAGSLMFMPLFAATLVCGFLIFVCFTIWFRYDERTYFFLTLIFSGLTWASGYGSYTIFRSIVKEKREANSIPYVPPVTADTLPAEEILVRASQESEQKQSNFLLRAAESAETPAEELLRASTSAAQEST